MSTTLDSLQKLFARDIDLLYKEIDAYARETSLWVSQGEIKNSAGNLCLHLCGNLQHFVGTVLGKTPYVRNRDAEFNDKNIPKADLLREITATKLAVGNTLQELDASALSKEYPLQVFGEPMSTEYFLIHLLSHLTYHRGQINYHRRLLS